MSNTSSPAPPAKTCGAQYILKDCQCLTDPFDRYSTICGYISKRDGLLYGCDTGCCSDNCDNLNKIPAGLENRPSAGVSLPRGYGSNIATSSEPTPTKGEAPFFPVKPEEVGNTLRPFAIQPAPGVDGTATPAPYKVWQVMLIAILPLILVLFLSCFI